MGLVPSTFSDVFIPPEIVMPNMTIAQVNSAPYVKRPSWLIDEVIHIEEGAVGVEENTDPTHQKKVYDINTSVKEDKQ